MSTPNVLVVGSNAALTEETIKQLASLGYNCTDVAYDLNSAVTIVNRSKVDVAIIDFSSGDELERLAIANILRKSFNTLIVYVTQTLDPLIVDQLSHGPAIGFILTPCTRTKLGTALENLLELEHERSAPWTTKLGRLNLVPPERLVGDLPASRRFGHL